MGGLLVGNTQSIRAANALAQLEHQTDSGFAVLFAAFNILVQLSHELRVLAQEFLHEGLILISRLTDKSRCRSFLLCAKWRSRLSANNALASADRLMVCILCGFLFLFLLFLLFGFGLL